MKLEDQVCSLDLARRLKELGVKQESAFWWAKVAGKGQRLFYEYPPKEMADESGIVNPFSAFTVAELGEILPDHLHLDGKSMAQYLFIAHGTKGGGAWVIGYSDYQTEGTPVFTDDNEANCRGKVLVYLIENGLWLKTGRNTMNEEEPTTTKEKQTVI